MLKWLRGRRDDERREARREEPGSAQREMEKTMSDEQAMDGGSDAADAIGAGGDGGNKNLSPAMQIRDRIIAVLKTVYDPEIPVDIYELGLVYGVDVNDGGEVHVTMTLTSPMCPVAESLPPEVEEKVRGVIGVKEVALDLVWDPPWSMDMMSDSARLELNLM